MKGTPSMTVPISEMTARLHPSEVDMAMATQSIDIGPPDDGQFLSELEPARMPGWLPITIGGARHMIKKLAYRENQAWKKEMEQVVQTLLPAFEKLDEAGGGPPPHPNPHQHPNNHSP
jgi:hypothetical protein